MCHILNCHNTSWQTSQLMFSLEALQTRQIESKELWSQRSSFAFQSSRCIAAVCCLLISNRVLYTKIVTWLSMSSRQVNCTDIIDTIGRLINTKGVVSSRYSQKHYRREFDDAKNLLASRCLILEGTTTSIIVQWKSSQVIVRALATMCH